MFTNEESFALVRLASAFDGRKPTSDMASAWRMALDSDSYCFGAAKQAVSEFYANPEWTVRRTWITPADINALASKIQRKQRRPINSVPRISWIHENTRPFICCYDAESWAVKQIMSYRHSKGEVFQRASRQHPYSLWDYKPEYLDEAVMVAEKLNNGSWERPSYMDEEHTKIKGNPQYLEAL